MATAEELLASVATYSSGDRNAHIVINEDRYVIVPDVLKAIAVQYDHNIETVTFDCPRFWDGHDFLDMSIYVNYRNPKGTTGRYPVTNIHLDPEDENLIHFDWTITNNITVAKGTFSFLVCVYTTDSQGSEERHWNSRLNQEMYILEGLESSNDAIAKQNPDDIENMLARLDIIEAGAGGLSYDELVNLHVWKQSYGDSSIVRKYNDEAIPILSKSSSGTYASIDYGTGISRNGSALTLKSSETIATPSASVLREKIIGTYIYSHYNNKYFYIPEGATIYEKTGTTGLTMMYVCPSYEMIVGTGFIQYVASTDSSAYPKSGTHTDGHVYEYYKVLAEGTGDGSSNSATSTVSTPGVISIEVGKSDDLIIIGYNLDDGTINSDVITLGSDGYPSKINVDGTDVSITWSGFTEEASS